MTTAAPRDDRANTAEELDERTLDAWSAYRESLRELTGRPYDEAETRSWDRLQEELTEISDLRTHIRVVG